jgi:hypothetical protein
LNIPNPDIAYLPFSITLRQIDKLAEPKGDYVWLDGTPLETGGYSNWGFNQPGDTWNREDCVVATAWGWDDRNCVDYVACGCQTEDRMLFFQIKILIIL